LTKNIVALSGPRYNRINMVILLMKGVAESLVICHQDVLAVDELPKLTESVKW